MPDPNLYLIAVDVSQTDDRDGRDAALRVLDASAPDPSRVLARFSTDFGRDFDRAANAGLYLRSHRADFARARAWIAALRRVTTDAVQAMPPAAQQAATIDAWRMYGAAFRALNVRPYAWAAFRRACEAAWGFPPERTAGRGNSDHYRGVGWTVSDTLAGPARVGATPDGTWREWASRCPLARAAFASGIRIPQPARVIFGDASWFDLETVGRVDTDVAIGTGERHRLWLLGSGLVARPTLGHADDPHAPELPFAGPTSGTGWTQEGLAIFWRGDPNGEADRCSYYLPAFFNYWALLRDPVPGLRAPGGDADLSLVDYLAAVLSTDTSALEWVRAVWRDCIVQNTLAAQAAGIRLAELGTEAEQQLQDARRAHDRETESRVQLATGASGVLGAVAGVAGGPVGILATGLLRIAVPAITRAVEDAYRTNGTRIDVFGRPCPAFERLELAISAGEHAALIDHDGAPMGLDVTTLPVGPLVLTVASPAAPGDAPTMLRVVGMPHGGGLSVDGRDAIAGGTWETDAMQVWLAPVAAGVHTVTVTAPPTSGAWSVVKRLEVPAEGATVDVPRLREGLSLRGQIGGDASPGAPGDAPPARRPTVADKARMIADINAGAMTADAPAIKDGRIAPTRATLRVVGMPHGGALTIDGHDGIAGGTWETDAMETWLATVDQGHHLVRVDAPGLVWSVSLPVDVPAGGATLDVRPAPPPAVTGEFVGATPTAAGTPRAALVVGGLTLAAGALALLGAKTGGPR